MMRDQVFRLSVAVLVVMAAGPAAAQTMLSNADVQMSVTTANEVVKVNTTVCMTGTPTQRVETPVYVQWFDFWKIQGRKDTTSAFDLLGTLSKDELKMTGPHIKVKAFAAPAINAVQFEVRYSQDQGKTWKRQVFGNSLRLCP